MSNYPPAGIHPVVWSRIKAKRKRDLKAEVKALYAINPVLWAVVKGYDTPERIATRFKWTSKWTDEAIDLAITGNHVKWWGSKLRPTQDRHKILRRRLLQ